MRWSHFLVFGTFYFSIFWTVREFECSSSFIRVQVIRICFNVFQFYLQGNHMFTCNKQSNNQTKMEPNTTHESEQFSFVTLLLCYVTGYAMWFFFSFMWLICDSLTLLCDQLCYVVLFLFHVTDNYVTLWLCYVTSSDMWFFFSFMWLICDSETLLCDRLCYVVLFLFHMTICDSETLLGDRPCYVLL